MSLLWPDRLHLSLAPGRAALLRVGGGWRPQLLEKHITECAQVETENLQLETWQAPLKALASLLSKHVHKSTFKAQCSVVLSNHYVRHLLLPVSDATMSDKEIQALAKHCFVETYGEAAHGWMIHVDPATGLACAIDQPLLDSLRAACNQAGGRLVSVQSYFSAGFNAAHQYISQKSSCFVQVEAGRLTIATLRDGSWHRLAGLSCGQDWPTQLATHLRREALLAGWESPPAKTYLFAPDFPQSSVTLEHPQQVQRLAARPLRGYSLLGDRDYAMAASGV